MRALLVFSNEGTLRPVPTTKEEFLNVCVISAVTHLWASGRFDKHSKVIVSKEIEIDGEIYTNSKLEVSPNKAIEQWRQKCAKFTIEETTSSAGTVELKAWNTVPGWFLKNMSLEEFFFEFSDRVVWLHTASGWFKDVDYLIELDGKW